MRTIKSAPIEITMICVLVMAPALLLLDDWKVFPWVGLRVLVALCTEIGISDGKELGVVEGFEVSVVREPVGACVVMPEEVTAEVQGSTVGLFEGMRVLEAGVKVGSCEGGNKGLRVG